MSENSRRPQDVPFAFAGAGHHHGWLCARCDKQKSQIGTKRLKYRGGIFKVCAECAKEMTK